MQKLKNYINRSSNEKIEWSIIVTLIILPIIIGVKYIYSFGVNVPFWDQWDVIPFYEKTFGNNLSISDLFTQHNESRLLFPRILMIILALITNYNTVSEMFFMYFLYCLSFIIVFLMYRKDHEINKISLILFIPISWFFFNLLQMSNMLLGIRIAQALEILTFLLAIYLIDLSKTFDKKFIGTIISAIISTFSFVSGLLTWPVIFIQIILTDSKEKMKKSFIWGLSGILVYILYFYNYKKPENHPSLLHSFYNPLDAMTIFLSSIGSTISRDLLSSQIIGALILIVTCCIILLNNNNLNLDRNTKWFSLMIYSFFISTEITVGRSGFGTSYGMEGRYLLLTFFSIIGLYCISINILKTCYDSKINNFNHLFLGIISCLLILGISTFFIIGIEYGTDIKQSREEMTYYLETYKIQPDKNLQKLYPDPSILRNRATFLEKYRLSVFSENNIDINILVKSDNDTLYHVDTINGKTVDIHIPIFINKEKDDEIIITGWAIDRYTSAGDIFITIDDKINIPTMYSIDRKDVSDTFKNDNFRYSGFMVSFASNIIENGNHTVMVKIVTTDKTRYYKSEQINISVT